MQLEENITSVKKKTDYLEKYSKELGEKITFMDANFSQRAGDLAVCIINLSLSLWNYSVIFESLMLKKD